MSVDEFRSIATRLAQASDDLQELSELIAFVVLEHPERLENMNTRSELAGWLGQIGGIGVGLGWIAKYEIKGDET